MNARNGPCCPADIVARVILKIQIDQRQHGSHRTFEVYAQVRGAEYRGKLTNCLGAITGNTLRNIAINHP